MSADTAGSVSEPDDAQQDVLDRLVELENRVDALQTKAKTAEDRAQEAEARADAAEERVTELEREVAALRDQTDLLQQVKKASALKPAERAAVLIQTLATEAASSDGRASMDANAAVKALGGDADRTNMYGEYGVFAKAVDLVGDEDVLWFREENRASQQNSRLILDLNEGELPATVAGHEVSTA